jgi:hypothetical protein
MKKLQMVLVALMGLVPTVAMAHGSEHPADPDLHVNPSLEDCSVQFAPELTQEAFGRFVREFGALGAFKMASPVTLGRRGFTIGLEQISFTIEEHSDAWNDTFYHPDATHELGSDKDFPKVRMAYGISDKLDVGAFYTKSPKANYGWFGVEAKYGLMRQSQNAPLNVAFRTAYTKTLYVDDMNMSALTLDISAGRTLWNVLTPYVAVGTDGVWASERSPVVDLDDEWQSMSHAIGGLELRYWHMTAGIEASLADISSLQIQFGAIF